MLLRSLSRRWIGERSLALSLHLLLNKQTYRCNRGVVLPTARGTAHIGRILVSPFGIFVIETKKMKGWIFGNATDEQWTQALSGKRHRFENPLHQNYRNTRCLAEFLKLEHSFFYSVIYFVGDCRFKSPMPPNVISSGLVSYVKTFTQPRLGIDRVAAIDAILRASTLNPQLSRRVHLASLRN